MYKVQVEHGAGNRSRTSLKESEFRFDFGVWGAIEELSGFFIYLKNKTEILEEEHV